MAILRGCARCGGDVLTGDRWNVRCLQCGHRPDAPIAEIRRRARGGLGRRPERYPKMSDFGLVEEAVPQPREGEVLAEGVRRGMSARPLLPVSAPTLKCPKSPSLN